MIIKPYLTISQQIQKLEEQGLIVSDKGHAKRILQTHSYYTIVNSYCDLLVDRVSPRRFKPGATFFELMAIRDFDTCFRRFLFPQILYIEEKSKASVIQAYCSATNPDGSFLHLADDYLLTSSYETINAKKQEAADKLVSDFKKAIENNKSQKPFAHALAEYGYVPFWIFAMQLSFGQVSHFYECNMPAVREEVAKGYYLSQGELRTILKILNSIRNCCAHNNRVYCMNIPFTLPNTLGIGRSAVTVDHSCDHKFGSVLYCLKFLLSKKKFQNIINELSNELTYLRKSLHVTSIEKVLKKMGISKNMLKEFRLHIK